MHTAVRQVSIHTVNLCQVLGAAYRAYIHFQFFVTTVIAVSQGKVYTLIISQRHRSADQGTDCFTVIVDRVSYILDLTAITKFPETSLQILFLDRSHVLCYMTVETVAYIRTVGNAFYDTIFLTELLHLKSAKTLCRCSVNCIKVTVLLFKLIDFLIDIFQNFQSKLAILGNGLAIIKFLKLI